MQNKLEKNLRADLCCLADENLWFWPPEKTFELAARKITATCWYPSVSGEDAQKTERDESRNDVSEASRRL